MVFAADISRTYEGDSYEIQDEGGMYLRDLFIQGAGWDVENNCLAINK